MLRYTAFSMELSFYGAAAGLAAIGYLGLAWAHRRPSAGSQQMLSSAAGQLALLSIIGLHGAICDLYLVDFMARCAVVMD
jgi:hypothetical protein